MVVGGCIETSEWIGSIQFGIGKGGFITQGDGLPPSENPLRYYNTEFNLVFNAIGAVLGPLIGEWYWRRKGVSSR